ncbi:MAG TPA: carboxypeptidase-like regulatory domain-containing protein, partial [Thermoanaerobaculia bacterium]
ARDLASPLALHLQPGQYELAVAVSHHVTFRKSVDVTPAPQHVTAVLRPLPLLSGIVTDAASNRPVSNAVIRSDAGVHRAITDAKGRFAFEADPEEWPKLITAAAEAYAEASLFVPLARASTILGALQLARGASIAVEIKQNVAGEVVEVDLVRLRANGRATDGVVKTRSVPPADALATIRFDDVPPGDYIVMAKGDEPCERQGERVTITAGEQLNTHLEINPFRLIVRVESAGTPLASANVTLRHRDFHWEGSFGTGEDGKASVNVWQGGRTALTVRVAAPGFVPYRERRTLSDGEDSEWNVEVPCREIVGTVGDRATGDTVRDAEVAMTMTPDEGGGFVVSTKTSADGTFRFAPVAHGRVELRAAAPGYPEGETSLVFREPEQSRHVTLTLNAATVTAVQVADVHGAPLAARVLNCRGVECAGMSNTDRLGKVPVLIPQGETHDVWVVPRDGSLAVIPLASGSAEANVRVPDANCRVVLRTESTSGVAIAGMFIVMRYEGRVVPPDVLHALSMMQGSSIISDARGEIAFNHLPSGAYEFWPLLSVAELHAVAAGGGPQPSVRMRVVPGENVAVLTFAESKALH